MAADDRQEHEPEYEPGHEPEAQQTRPSSGWQEELAALLAAIEAAHTPEAEAAVFARIAALDPGLRAFLVAQMSGQQTPESAAFLETLAAQPATPADMRALAREALAGLAAQGVLPSAPGAEAFHSGWAQLGRERGEQIMILGWRLPDGRMEALVFLLDWRGDGLKDFYRTREISDGEWRELVAHNSQKGAPLVEITLGEGRVLLEEALAEGQRFSRPVPREYKIAQPLVQRRVLDAAARPAPRRGYVTPDLSPEAVVAAYVRALHQRDYALAWELLAPELLAPEHPARAGAPNEPDGEPDSEPGSAADRERAAGIAALRLEWKHAPRRRPEVSATLEPGLETPGGAEDTTARVLALGEAETVERTGRRVRAPVRERYTLRRTPDGWRITAIAPA